MDAGIKTAMGVGVTLECSDEFREEVNHRAAANSGYIPEKYQAVIALSSLISIK